MHNGTPAVEITFLTAGSSSPELPAPTHGRLQRLAGLSIFWDELTICYSVSEVSTKCSASQRAALAGSVPQRPLSDNRATTPGAPLQERQPAARRAF